MATVASFNVALVASTGRFIGAISRAERQWNQFARSIQRQAKILPESIRSAVPASLALGRNIVKLGAVAGAVFSGLAIWGVRLAAQWEQTEIAFTTLLGSAESANKFLGELVEFAARTPFNLTNIAQASRQLLAYGFTAEQVLPTLSAIGDAVSALGGGADEIQRAVLAIGQMQAKGKIAGEEMRQLTELGIPAWEMLAESIGVSIPEAMKLVEKRAIDASTGIAAVLEGVNRRFAGAMEVQSKTLLGRLSTLRDNIEIILRGLGQDILRLTRLGERIDRLTTAVSRFAAAVTEHGFIGALRRAFPPWIQAVIVGITGAIVGGLVPAIVAWLIPALKKLSISLWATLKPLLPWMAVGAAVALTAYFLAKAWGHLGDVARVVWSSIAAIALYGASLVVRGIGLILAGVGAIVPAFRGAAQAVLGLADSLKNSASQSVAAARSAIQTIRAAQQAESAQTAVAKAGQKASQTQQQLAEDMEALTKAAGNNIQSFDEVHQIQEQMASSPSTALDIEEPAIPALGGITNIASAIGEQVAQIADTAANAWTRLQQAMEPVNRAVQWIKHNWPTIGPIVEGIAGVIMMLLVPALIKTGVEAMIAGGKVLASWAMQAAGAVVHGAKIVGQLVLAGAKWAWLGIQAIVNAGKVVLAWAMQGWQAVSSVATQVAQFALAGAKWLWLGIQAGIGAAQVVAAWVAQQVQAIASVGVQIAQFVILGAKWVWMGIVAMANAAKMAAAWFIAFGPIAWVTAAIIGVAILVATNWEFVKQKTAELWGAATEWLAAKWQWVKDAAANVWAAIKEHIIVPIQTAWDWLKDAWSSITEYLSKAWASIKETASKVWDGIARAVKSPINAIISAINWMIRGLNKINFTVPSWVPIFGGKSWGFNIPEIPLVPLAEGGIVTRPVTALVGEAGPEVIRPLEREEAMADQIAQAVYRAIVDAMRVTQATSQSAGDREVVLKVDGVTLARVLLPAMVREGQRIGMPVVVRPQGV